ncbi:MAG: GGDEF domain-containing protein [Xanthomonadales bacterium]|nr:GGDEF domain-containing protein [Xanthomonadales bacterium]
MPVRRHQIVHGTRWRGVLAGALLCASTLAHAALADRMRHPLELEALTEPERVLEQLPALIAEASAHGASADLARLELARANACRVVADWRCQREAGAAAHAAASAAGAHHLGVRGLIAEARARIALQDFAQAERRLGAAEASLARHPDGGLLADVMLAYSSLALQLDRHTLMRDYAKRGIDALGDELAAVVRSRLLRNLGRAELELGNPQAARAAMLLAAEVAAPLDDPKLISELDLELARIARNTRDPAEQRAAGERVLAVAERFGNAQIAALGHEVLGLAARDANELATAEVELAAATAGFGELGMPTEERRALRELLRTQLQHQPQRRDVMPGMLRLMELDETMDRRDRARAGEDFDARLRYAQQEFELQRLAKESELAAEREKSLAASNRQRALLVALALSAVLVITAFLALQRRANRQLAATNARLRLTEQQLEREARYDALTGLANRREFESRLTDALAQATTVALLFLDLDHLKQTNDAHGHAGGDELLRVFAKRLQACVPPDALVARIGGDEFVVLLAEPDAVTAVASAEAMAAAICAAMAAPLLIGDRSLPLATSIGIAVARTDSDRDQLMSAADRALYAAKAAGRNTWRRET